MAQYSTRRFYRLSTQCAAPPTEGSVCVYIRLFVRFSGVMRISSLSIAFEHLSFIFSTRINDHEIKVWDCKIRLLYPYARPCTILLPVTLVNDTSLTSFYEE